MAHEIDIARAQRIMAYRFSDPSWLASALCAPEKVQDTETERVLSQHDGNRCLAQLGRKVIETILVDRWFSAGSDRETNQNTTARLANNEVLAQIARRTGLHNCVKQSQRQEGDLPSSQTLKLVTTAVIGAAWLDSDRNFYRTGQVLEALGIIELDLEDLDLKSET